MSEMSLRKMVRALEQFRAIDPEMQVATILALLYPSLEEGMYQKKLEEKLGVSNAAASRNVSYWSKWKRHEVAGQDFMTNDPDPRDRRFRILELTNKGKAFIHQLISALE